MSIFLVLDTDDIEILTQSLERRKVRWSGSGGLGPVHNQWLKP